MICVLNIFFRNLHGLGWKEKPIHWSWQPKACSTLSLLYNLSYIKLWKDCIKLCVATYCLRFVFWLLPLLSVKGNSLWPKKKKRQKERSFSKLCPRSRLNEFSWPEIAGNVLLSHCFTPTFSCLVTVCSFDYLTWLTVANLTDYNCQWVWVAESGIFFWESKQPDLHPNFSHHFCHPSPLSSPHPNFITVF